MSYFSSSFKPILTNYTASVFAHHDTEHAVTVLLQPIQATKLNYL